MGLLNFNDFKQKIGNPALSTRYEVEIGLPSILRAKLSVYGYDLKEFNNSVKFLAHFSQLPTMQMSTTKVYHRGQPFIMRGAVSFSDTWNIKFYNTADMFLHTVFSEWMYAIDQYDNLVTKSLFLGNYVGFDGIGAGYMNDAKLHIKRADGEDSATYKISYIYPTYVSDVEFNSEQQSSLTSTEVRFAFSMYKKQEGSLKNVLKTLF